MASRISTIVLILLSGNLSPAGAVDYIATGPATGDAGSPVIIGYQSVSSGLVTVYTPVIAVSNAGSQCAQPGVAYRPVMPPASTLPVESAAACSPPGSAYRLMVSPLVVPGFVAPTPTMHSIDADFPAGVK